LKKRELKQLVRDKEIITQYYSGIKRQATCKELRTSAAEVNKVVSKFNARLKRYCEEQDVIQRSAARELGC
jgi:hypothetical protein